MQKLKSLLRSWPLFLGATIGVIAGLAYALLIPTTYTATSVMFLTSPASTDSIGAYQGDLFSQQRATTYVQLFASDDLATKVIDDLGLKATPSELKQKVVASQVPKTVLMTVSATDTSAQRATDIANAYAANFNDYVQRLETSRVTGTPAIAVSIVNKAVVPKTPSSVALPIVLAAGLAGGLVLGGVAMWAWRRWRSPKVGASSPATAAKLVDDARQRASATVPSDSAPQPTGDAVPQPTESIAAGSPTHPGAGAP
ncbi:capsular polysaccharide biosynthesis protein [Mycobacterium sp. MAA66]|uniref:YveK family protein n=1 Tax=Mycobacterium sp. MAA66 TaxID=3156297 RepID=UPI00351917C7